MVFLKNGVEGLIKVILYDIMHSYMRFIVTFLTVTLLNFLVCLGIILLEIDSLTIMG